MSHYKEQRVSSLAKSQVNMKNYYLLDYKHDNGSHNISIQRSYNNQGPIYMPTVTHVKNEKLVKSPFMLHIKQLFWITKCKFNLILYVNRNLRASPSI